MRRVAPVLDPGRRRTKKGYFWAVARDDRPGAGPILRPSPTSDPSYAAYFGTANVLAEKVTLINRVNQIYNDDLGDRAAPGQRDRPAQPRHRGQGHRRRRPVRHARRASTTADPGDPATGELDFCDLGTLGQNRTVLGQLVGASNYDIGHIALGINGGGVAYLGVVGGDYKARRLHRPAPSPRGDFFAIDYVAHEMGHQFGGNHTFNGALGNCRRQHLRAPRSSPAPARR